MTQRERQASGGTKAAPWRALGHPALPPSGASPEPRTASAPLWEDLCRSVSPAQQMELLALAERQGVLYSHQLPPAGNGTPRDRTRQLLTQLLSGQTEALEPVAACPVEVHDTALDPQQRAAVAKALHTPDLCLVQGLPGTGKSRVVAEMLTQAAARGERVLFLAPTPAALDRVLEIVGPRDVVFCLRCLERDETPETLPPAIRALTFVERVRCLREETLPRARQEVEDSVQRRGRFEHEEPVWDRFAELLQRCQTLDEQLEALQARRSFVPVEVEREAANPPAEASADSFARILADCQRTHEAALRRLDSALAALRVQQEERQQEQAALATQREALRPLVEAKQQGHWWNPAWWQATLGKDRLARWDVLESRHQQLQGELEGLEQQTEALGAERQRAVHVFQVEHAEQINAEIARRQTDLKDQEAALRQELLLLHQKWESLGRELGPTHERPAGLTHEAVRSARESWCRRREQTEERTAFARQWAAYLEQAAQTLAERLPSYANVVAATTTALASDPHYGEAAGDPAGPIQFDWLVLEEADQVTESEFLSAARRARRWIVVGAPTGHREREEAQASSSPASPGKKEAPRRPVHIKPVRPTALRPGFFQRLWQHLHLPHVWTQEKDRLCCRLRPVAPEQRCWLQSEPVADFPDIELRILTAPRVTPTLAEVVFPLSMSISQAKQYLFQQLQELPIQTSSPTSRWIEEPDRLVLRLADLPATNAVPVVLEAGVCEMVGRIAPEANGDRQVEAAWQTCCLEFDRSAGWEPTRAQAWVRQHMGLRDLGRTVFLDVPYRMQPDLAAFLTDLLFAGACRPANSPTLPELSALQVQGCRAPVQFVPVPPLPKEAERGRAAENERRPSVLARKGGAGLELDLADLRHRDRLPTELRAGLPAQGLVNYLEAKALVQMLTALVADPAVQTAAASGTGTGQPAIAVIALYDAQVQMLRRLIQQTPSLASCGVPIQVGLPQAFRQREALVVLLSLTRSHTHRAVTYGDGPQALALALTRARAKLVLFGDPGTLVRRSQWEGALDHLDESTAARERELLAQLVRYLHGHGAQTQAIHVCTGSGP
ncbi:MAG: AAA domain-containing protein, partial [Gemmataceae bacterium]|nr:AAA domain-containing protein [Gemmataceae bacterium]